jgi:hypothetical protein
MFAKTIIDSDAFLDMPLSSQALYFHLSMRADDDGFINNPKKIARMLGVGDDDIKILMGKKFLISFESGVVVIKHWKIHNYIQKDRYTPSNYFDEKQRLTTTENRAYSLDTECIHHVSNPDTQVRLGKEREELGKEREELGKERDNKPRKRVTASRPNDDDALDGFEIFWGLYDKKTSRAEAEKVWKKSKLTEDVKQEVYRAAEKYAQSTPDKQYRKNPATWLNGRCWNDEIIEKKQELTMSQIARMW